MNRERVAVVLLFVFFMCVGFVMHDNYGVSADEPAMRQFGIETYRYLFEGKSPPQAVDWKFHGPVVQLALAAAEKFTGVTDGKDVWAQRHALQFILFLFGVAATYAVAKRLTKDWRWALVASIWMLLSPRILAHAFFNPKDIPAMSLFAISAFTHLRFLEKKSLARLCAHALFSALTVSLRPFGLIIVLLTCASLLVQNDRPLSFSVRRAVGFVAACFLFLVALWPMLWESPIEGFFAAFADNASRGAGGLYFGEVIDEMPLLYLPVWIALTIPPLYSLLSVVGLWVVLKHFVRSPLHFAREQHVALLVLAWVAVPLLSQMILGIGLFNEWRHLYFMYPAIVLLAVLGLQYLHTILRSARLQIALLSSVLLLSLHTAVWIVRFHPFEYLYFSVPASFVQGKFDLDYWNLTYRFAFEKILSLDKRKRVPVFPVVRTALAGADTLPLNEWERLDFTTPDRAEYVIDNYHRTGYKMLISEDRLVFPIAVDGLRAAGVYRGPVDPGLFERWW